ncbi:MAG: UDP-N-acetylmuramoyl-L-alanyl-D-glutamate--2,6-diaminopimelate ligase, partial [Bacteroidales bacterium]|nr:UDP-N-acetylmuramoyl-L-alanyl-D-glutamate--2,6-diaminopimelate ligase [Bacteroidales bacterium]
MKETKEIVGALNIKQQEGQLPETIANIVFDSRKADTDSLFVAIIGTQTDGHQYINQVIEAGASVIICQNEPESFNPDVCYLMVEDSAEALALLASAWYEHPSRDLKLVGITGTNGKTSTVTMLYNLHLELGYACGLLSTVRNLINQKPTAATHTTPDALEINKMLRQMVDEGCEYCFMEVSSHALVQHRTTGLHFSVAIFSNITHDHLDYHKTFKEYIRAKKLLFDRLDKTAVAIINEEDKNSSLMVQNTLAKVFTFSIQTMADYRAKVMENSFSGLQLLLDGSELWIPLVGKFNAQNILAVYAASRILGHKKEEILPLLSKIKGAEGRFESIKSQNNITAIVDYAHTPDALKNVLSTINEIRTGNEQLITVVGAGGDRDKTKRPEMAKIASQMS